MAGSFIKKVKKFFGKIKKLFKKSSSKVSTEPNTKQVNIQSNTGNLLTVSTKITSRPLLAPKPIIISLRINLFPKFSPLRQLCMLFSTEALIISALATIAKAKHYEVAFGQKTLGAAKSAGTEHLELTKEAASTENLELTEEATSTQTYQVAGTQLAKPAAATELTHIVARTEHSQAVSCISSCELASCTNSSELSNSTESSQLAVTNSTELATTGNASQLAPTTERKSNRQRKNRTNRRMTVVVQPDLSMIL
jgi:hypothetical protein